MPIPLVTDPPARAGTRPAAIPQEMPMTHERHFPNEDPATTHARLSAAVVAAHANACAAADAFLSGGAPPDLRQMPPKLKLTRNEAGRVAVIDTGTPDEREFTSHEALRAYVRRCVVMSLTVRRDGWTLPDPEDARIEPDSAPLLLRPGNPVVDIVARIGMDRSLDAAHLRYNAAQPSKPGIAWQPVTQTETNAPAHSAPVPLGPQRNTSHDGRRQRSDNGQSGGDRTAGAAATPHDSVSSLPRRLGQARQPALRPQRPGAGRPRRAVGTLPPVQNAQHTVPTNHRRQFELNLKDPAPAPRVHTRHNDPPATGRRRPRRRHASRSTATSPRSFRAAPPGTCTADHPRPSSSGQTGEHRTRRHAASSAPAARRNIRHGQRHPDQRHADQRLRRRPHRRRTARCRACARPTAASPPAGSLTNADAAALSRERLQTLLLILPPAVAAIVMANRPTMPPHVEYEAHKKLVAALAKARGKIPSVPMDKTVDYVSKRTGEHVHYNFASLDSMHKTVTESLSEHGLVLQCIFNGDVIVVLLSHEEGGIHLSRLPLPDESDVKDMATQITMRRRYLTNQLIEIVADEDTGERDIAEPRKGAGRRSTQQGRQRPPGLRPPTAAAQQGRRRRRRAASRPSPAPSSSPTAPPRCSRNSPRTSPTSCAGATPSRTSCCGAPPRSSTAGTPRSPAARTRAGPPPPASRHGRNRSRRTAGNPRPGKATATSRNRLPAPRSRSTSTTACGRSGSAPTSRPRCASSSRGRPPGTAQPHQGAVQHGARQRVTEHVPDITNARLTVHEGPEQPSHA